MQSGSLASRPSSAASAMATAIRRTSKPVPRGRTLSFGEITEVIVTIETSPVAVAPPTPCEGGYGHEDSSGTDSDHGDDEESAMRLQALVDGFENRRCRRSATANVGTGLDTGLLGPQQSSILKRRAFNAPQPIHVELSEGRRHAQDEARRQHSSDSIASVRSMFSVASLSTVASLDVHEFRDLPMEKNEHQDLVVSCVPDGNASFERPETVVVREA